MELWRSIPFACILLPLGSAAITSALRREWARNWTIFVLLVETALSIAFMVIMSSGVGSYTYRMGHYSAPWGNEIRAGQLEAIVAHFFSLIMLFSLLGGLKKIKEHVMDDKQSLYYVMVLLLTASLMAQVYTNDTFTAYVFVEIMTLSAAALIAARPSGRTIVASARYIVMNMIGSSLFLLGLCMLYGLTGHLLMSNMKEAIADLYASGQYQVPLTVSVALITSGLAIKGALFPFHTWVPDAYGSSTPASAAMLSSLVSKGYIFLSMKMIYRVYGFEVFRATGIDNVLFVFGIAAMIMGSVFAIRQNDIRQMVAYSSVAQIGYIYMGIGMGTEYGMVAAVFHIFTHSVCKSMLFLSISGLSDASGGANRFHELRGCGVRAKVAGAAFTIGALGMVGFPMLSGFTSKINFASAAVLFGGRRMWLVLAALVISTFLNTMYFMRAMITVYRVPADDVTYPDALPRQGAMYNVGVIGLAVINITLGIFTLPIVEAIRNGLAMFG